MPSHFKAACSVPTLMPTSTVASPTEPGVPLFVLGRQSADSQAGTLEYGLVVGAAGVDSVSYERAGSAECGAISRLNSEDKSGSLFRRPL